MKLRGVFDGNLHEWCLQSTAIVRISSFRGHTAECTYRRCKSITTLMAQTMTCRAVSAEMITHLCCLDDDADVSIKTTATQGIKLVTGAKARKQTAAA
jgi:hypothetical protein